MQVPVAVNFEYLDVIERLLRWDDSIYLLDPHFRYYVTAGVDNIYLGMQLME